MTLTLDSSRNAYIRNGTIILPRTTAVLDEGDWWFVPPEDREFYLARGREVHRACALLDGVKHGHTLNWATLDPRIKPFVQAWQKFKEDFAVEVCASETPLYHPHYHYAGTPDGFGYVKKRPALWDRKCGASVHPKEALQTGSYAKMLLDLQSSDPDHAALLQNFYGKRIKAVRRYSVHLHETGHYKVKEWMEYDLDVAAFLCYLTVYNWKQKHGLNGRKADAPSI